MCEISVVMAVRNGGKFIERTLQSILSQTYTDIEVIVIDDGSTDDTAKIVSFYSQTDHRVVLTINPGLPGNAHARNYGVSLSTGKWIAICDADDTWVPEKLGRQVSFRDNWNGIHPLVAIGTAGWTMNERDKVVSPLDACPLNVEEFYGLTRNCEPLMLHHSSVIFEKSAFVSVGGYREDYMGAEDTELFTRLAQRGVVLSIPDRLFYYRKHLGSFQLSKTRMQLLNLIRIRENALRTKVGLQCVDYDEFVQEFFKKMAWGEKVAFRMKCRGKYLYRIGAINAANSRYVKGGLCLILAAFCDFRLVAASVKRVIRLE
ncbi:glycosyltransferase family 2 protein [Alicyclobacillus mengziensis]|uniref:Glycosyltransferase family 2 protein n=1 Tax=Alicyclobacillus mengziensis TaxID=2931921 RepID=A0A9X7VV04_9BACL|nr:glycosyltransferase family A protein [Alicyclobacillus mengziensis]QSO45442.1 glycosyltransferase family 2 protein [Alicyclobacillus mengziensis]